MRPIRSLSQNFLVDKNICHKFVELTNPNKDDFFLEIGPGRGAITSVLLEHGCKVVAVEKDLNLVEHLERTLPSNNLEIISGDILKTDLSSFLPPDQKVKVISNLPFQITSPILGLFLPRHDRITTMSFILQKEVADRICAKPKTKAYSSLTLFTQFYSLISFGFSIPKSCYTPKPKVETSALQFQLKPPPFEEADLFFKLVHTAFQKRRKMISTSVPLDTEKVRSLLESLGLSPFSRPEELSLEEWIKLFQLLEPDL